MGPAMTGTNMSSADGIHEGVHLLDNMFGHVSKPIIICLWIMTLCIAKVIFNNMRWLSETIPETCMLILLGLPIGALLNSFGITGHLFLTSELFFQFLLPPIIFDAGYYIQPGCFFNNIGTILMYAVLGTLWNTFLVGVSLYGVAGTAKVNISLCHSLLFGALISAVDPVAVLGVLAEVQVNNVLYMLVFGESLLNDAVSVVLYRTFEHLPQGEGYIEWSQVALAIASFFLSSTVGILFGVVFGFIASFTTRFTRPVRYLEPLLVLTFAWLAYLTAEIWHCSGIISILFCAIYMRPYVESNICRKSHTTIKYFLKLLASSCEAVIFLFLGITLVQYRHNFNMVFIVWCIFFISVYRTLGVISLTWLANRYGRLEAISKTEQLIMSYGGLRGAVAFCLAIVLHLDNMGHAIEEEVGDLKRVLVTTTLAVIIFTCFVQGGTMKWLVTKVAVQLADQHEVTILEHINERALSYTMAGIEEILGVHGHGFFMNLWQLLNQKVLRRCLEREPGLMMEDSLFQMERKYAYKHATGKSPFLTCSAQRMDEDPLCDLEGNNPTAKAKVKENLHHDSFDVNSNINTAYNRNFYLPRGGSLLSCSNDSFDAMLEIRNWRGGEGSRRNTTLMSRSSAFQSVAEIERIMSNSSSVFRNDPKRTGDGGAS